MSKFAQIVVKNCPGVQAMESVFKKIWITGFCLKIGLLAEVGAKACPPEVPSDQEHVIHVVEQVWQALGAILDDYFHTWQSDPSTLTKLQNYFDTVILQFLSLKPYEFEFQLIITQFFYKQIGREKNSEGPIWLLDYLKYFLNLIEGR